MNDLDYTENGRDYIHGYCLNVMLPTFFSIPHEIMGALFHCPFCGTITDKVGEETENTHIFHPNKKLIEALKSWNIYYE